MRATIVAASRPYDGGGPEKVDAMAAHFTGAPGWNGGNFYEKPNGVFEALKKFRADVLRRNGLESELLATTGGNAAVAASLLDEAATGWACQTDANSLITLTRAGSRFDVSRQVGQIKSPLLYVLCDTDSLYPASAGPEAVAQFKALGVDVSFHEVKTKHRHRGGLVDYAKWSDVLSEFLAAHAAP